MYTEFTRPMNDRERAVLSAWISIRAQPPPLATTLKWAAIWIAGVAISLAACTALFSLIPDGPVRTSLALLKVALIGTAIALVGLGGILSLLCTLTVIGSYRFRSVSHRDFLTKRLPQLQAALADGNVRVQHVSATAVLSITELDDEGPGYLFDIGDNQTLLLQGQDITPATDDMPWPSSEFEIVRTVLHDINVGIFTLAPALEPVREIENSDAFITLTSAGGQAILDQRFETLVATLAAATEEPPSRPPAR